MAPGHTYLGIPAVPSFSGLKWLTCAMGRQFKVCRGCNVAAHSASPSCVSEGVVQTCSKSGLAYVCKVKATCCLQEVLDDCVDELTSSYMWVSMK
eukprot:1160978-Pelagomonas_calceolata.AAC.6